MFKGRVNSFPDELEVNMRQTVASLNRFSVQFSSGHLSQFSSYSFRCNVMIQTKTNQFSVQRSSTAYSRWLWAKFV